MAVATKPKTLTPAKFREIKVTLRNLRQNHGEDIDRNTFLRFGASIFADMELMAKHIEKLQGPTEPEPEEVDDDEETGA